MLNEKELTEAMGNTAKEIKKVKHDIKETADLIRKKKLKRLLKDLQYRQLYQMEKLERL